MSARQAKDYGLIDGIITNPLKAFAPLPDEEWAKLRESGPELDEWKKMPTDNFPVYKAVQS